VDSVAGANVSTIESLACTRVGRALQKAWLDQEVPQCGCCQSGQPMPATTLLTKNPAPTDANIDAAMSGNICRCRQSAERRWNGEIADRKLFRLLPMRRCRDAGARRKDSVDCRGDGETVVFSL